MASKAKNRVMKLMGDGSLYDQQRIVCPICRFDYVHPVGVECNPAGHPGKSVAVDANGLTVLDNEPIGGGVCIVLKFYCEDGHGFEHQLHFHKGMTFVRTEINSNLVNRATIWRD